MAGYIPRWYTRPKTVTRPSTNRVRRALTSFMRRTPLTTTPRCLVSSTVGSPNVFTLFYTRCHRLIHRRYQNIGRHVASITGPNIHTNPLPNFTKPTPKPQVFTTFAQRKRPFRNRKQTHCERLKFYDALAYVRPISYLLDTVSAHRPMYHYHYSICLKTSRA